MELKMKAPTKRRDDAQNIDERLHSLCAIW